MERSVPSFQNFTHISQDAERFHQILFQVAARQDISCYLPAPRGVRLSMCGGKKACDCAIAIGYWKGDLDDEGARALLVKVLATFGKLRLRRMRRCARGRKPFDTRSLHLGNSDYGVKLNSSFFRTGLCVAHRAAPGRK